LNFIYKFKYQTLPAKCKLASLQLAHPVYCVGANGNHHIVTLRTSPPSW